MSRIGKKPIEIPPEVKVSIEGQKLTIEGPKGTLSLLVSHHFQIIEERNRLVLEPKVLEEMPKDIKALWGTERQRLANAIKGVKEGYEKRLEIEGVGYRASLEEGNLVLMVGFTHPVKLRIPAGINVDIDKNIIKVSGIEKEKVGEFAKTVRAVKPVEPYKGKGIKYEGEVIRRKLGKRAAVAVGGLGSAGATSAK